MYSKKKSKPKKVKQLNPNIPTYERTADIIMPKKISNDIKPKEIFEGIKEVKPKKRPTTKKGGRKKK
jgi:hypothetical protein